MRARPQVVLPAVVAFLVALSGCAGTADVGESSSAVPTTSSAPVSTPSTNPAGEPGTPTSGAPQSAAVDAAPETAEPSADARVTVRDVRVGLHEGYDRVVFEVGGTGTPGWDVRYVDRATEPGRGQEIELAGDAVLQVRITGAGYPYDTGVEEFAAAGPVPGSGTEVVTEVAFAATFEGVTTSFVGTRAQAPFRVYPLEAPARVVVEVAHPG
ncbi:AMIN-like domain-containing (lipo)protein [Blastococcus sp. SYSU DS0533]